MRIKRIKIQNFRSFDSEGIEVDLPESLRKPISIVGHNNSGKSNLVNAILLAMGQKSVSNNTFTENDFYCRNTGTPFLIETEVLDPLMSTGAYNQISEMPIFQLEVTKADEAFEYSHYFCKNDGSKVFNPRATKRSKTKEYNDNEKEVLNAYQKSGAEMVWKWKSDIPLYFIDSTFIEKQLQISNYTLLGKIINEARKDFESKDNTVEDIDGVVASHVGSPRKEIFENAIEYLEKFVLSTENFNTLIAAIEKIVKEQLDISDENLRLKFGFPSADSLFKNLEFYLTDNPEKPVLPINQMGRGFISLFVVALFKAITLSDEGGKIFIVEEPETYLHEHFQEYFYQILCKLAEKNQVIYTTHSKKFIDVFSPETIIKINNPKYLKSEVVYPGDSKTIEIPNNINDFCLTNPDDFAKYLKTLEPNLGNILFSSKVLIVEGPHDILAYKTIFQNHINFGLKNISVVSAWGKDSLIAIIDMCEIFNIDYFVIHDWDLDSDTDPNSLPAQDNEEDKNKLTADKAQWTKNKKILDKIGNESKRHCNKRNLESILKIDRNRKGTVSIYEKLQGKDIDTVKTEFPGLISNELVHFLQS